MKKLKVLAILLPLLPLLSLLTVLIFIAACSNSSSGGSDEAAVAASEPASNSGQEEAQEPGCSSDSDCPEGYLCNSYGECVPDPSYFVACSEDSNCPSGYWCVGQRCLPIGCLAVDEDGNCRMCADNYELRNDVCVSMYAEGTGRCSGNVIQRFHNGRWEDWAICDVACDPVHVACVASN